jgi:hypothetical protein
MCVSDYNDPRMYGLSGGDDYIAQNPGLLKATQFTAKLLPKGKLAFGIPTVAGVALWLATEGKEQIYGDPKLSWYEVGERQVLVPVATTWLLIAGEILYSHCLEGKGGLSAMWSKARWSL